MASERLQKILSRAGVASRRKAEEMITDGRVTVNGRTVTELGTKADPGRERIKVDGRDLPRPAPHTAPLSPQGCAQPNCAGGGVSLKGTLRRCI